MRNVKSRSKSNEKNAFVWHFPAMNGKLWSEISFLSVFGARDDLIKVLWKRDAQRCQNGVTPLTLTPQWKVPAPFKSVFTLFLTLSLLQNHSQNWQFLSRELFVNKLKFQGKSVFKTIFQTTCSKVCCHTQKVSLWQNKKTLIEKHHVVWFLFPVETFFGLGFGNRAREILKNTTF